jgi:hypothetical protein
LSEKPQAPKEFEPIEDLNEALKLVKEGAKTLSTAMVWTKDQEHVINTHVSVYSEAGSCFYCWVPKGFDPKKFMDDLAKMSENECFFSISLQRANIFFKTRFIGFDSAGLQFKLPSKVYKVQRRKDLRFPVPDGIAIKVEYKDPLAPDTRISKKVLDISASGLAFLIPEAEAPLYPSGLTLQDFSFSIRNKKITVSVEIRHARKLGPDSRAKGFAVGVLFKDIRPGDGQHIAGYVFEESRKYFSRFI